MPNVKNTAYHGDTGSVVINADTHLGVTSIVITPTYPEEQVPDIGGDVQSIQGTPTHRVAVEFHQDHITDGSLSRISTELAGTIVPITYTPQAGGEGRTLNVRMKAAPFGGGTARHAGTLDLAVIGQPVVVPPVP